MNWKSFLTSRKTTIMGICTILGAVCTAVVLVIDEDPATNPDWPLVFGTIMGGIGLIFSRDADKSSQDSGIRK